MRQPVGVASGEGECGEPCRVRLKKKKMPGSLQLCSMDGGACVSGTWPDQRAARLDVIAGGSVNGAIIDQRCALPRGRFCLSSAVSPQGRSGAPFRPLLLSLMARHGAGALAWLPSLIRRPHPLSQTLLPRRIYPWVVPRLGSHGIYDFTTPLLDAGLYELDIRLDFTDDQGDCRCGPNTTKILFRHLLNG